MTARWLVVGGMVAGAAVGACNRAPAGAGAEAGTEAGAGAGATASTATPASTATSDDGGFVSAMGALQAEPGDGGAVRALAEVGRAGAMVDIPAGAFPSGSTPGDEGRDPSVEPALVEVTLGAYAIDALPFPNDPAVPFKTGTSIEEATRLCRDRGARLCSELEWERACKGPEHDAFASGTRWNPACEKERARCASGTGARALGTAPELTDSRFVATESGEGAPVLRGGSGGPTTHRCAARTRLGQTTQAESTFRCCKGAANAPRIAAIEPRQAFKKAGLEPGQLAKIFAQVPELARIGSDLRYFTEGDVRAMTARGGAGSSHEGITFTTAPILWSPEPGAELLVAAGRGKSMSFVVALWTLPGERHRFASSFLMLNDLSPVALAYETAHRKELRWTSCWGCPGEQGAVSYRADEHRVVIVQQ